MPRSWSDALVAWLHDPPDKALDILGHEVRARRYLAAALGRAVTENEQKSLADSLAAAIERLPMPRGTGDDTAQRRVGTEALIAVHPLSAAERAIAARAIDEGGLVAQFGSRILASWPSGWPVYTAE